MAHARAARRSELLWAILKRYLRKYWFLDRYIAHKSTVQRIMEALPVVATPTVIRRCCRHARIYAFVHLLGLDARTSAWLAKQFSSHRTNPGAEHYYGIEHLISSFAWPGRMQ